MSWPEVVTAKNENRHEIILNGAKINERIAKEGFDKTVFDLTSLNYLNVSETILSNLPREISNLKCLQTLVLHSNKLSDIPEEIFLLDKLKVLDLSRNMLQQLPEGLSNLVNLTTLNVSLNQLVSLPCFEKNTKLSVLNASNNKLKDFPDVCYSNLSSLSDLQLKSNEIEIVPASIGALCSLKTLDVSGNQIKSLPGELSDCGKIKELNLKGNPISDRRLLKLIDQCHTKKVLDYIKQHCPKSIVENGDAQNSKKGKKGTTTSNNHTAAVEKLYKIHVQHAAEEGLKVVVLENVKSVRAHLVGCIVKNLEFTEDTFKKFIQLQSKLHDTICQKRNLATIATHDLKKLNNDTLTYTAMAPNKLEIKPLNRNTTMTGAALFTQLQTEADNLRKEKKRNVYSGIHKYLYLLEGQKIYPCLLNSNKEVISFPPITNSEITKISIETTSLFIEVTSAATQSSCKNILNNLIKEMVFLFGKDLTVQQVKNVDAEGNLKAVYPSRNDLVFENEVPIEIIRE